MRRQVRHFGLLTAGAACASLTLGATPAPAGEWRIQPSVTVSETFSDNVDQEPSGDKTAAFTTGVSPRVRFRKSGGRVSTTLDLGLTANHQTDGEDKGARVDPSVAGLASAEILEEHLFLDASISASSELLNTRDRDTSDDRTIVHVYEANPKWVSRFGDFADTDISYIFNQVVESGSSSSNLSNSQTHSVAGRLSSGMDFNKLRWTLRSSASISERSDAQDVKRGNAAVDLEYAIDRSFSVLGSAGFQTFDDGDDGNDIEDPTWNAGARWRPGPRTSVLATYGQSDGEESFAGQLRYMIGTRTRIFANYKEVLETGQERLVQDLSNIGTDPDTGELIDTQTGLPFDPTTSTTTLNDNTQRTRTFSAGVSGASGRNSYGIQANVEFSEDENVVSNNEDAYKIAVNAGRKLSTSASVRAKASFTRNEFDSDNRQDNKYAFGARYTYNVYTNISAFGGYDFELRKSNRSDNDFLENVVSLGVGVTF